MSDHTTIALARQLVSRLDALRRPCGRDSGTGTQRRSEVLEEALGALRLLRALRGTEPMNLGLATLGPESAFQVRLLHGGEHYVSTVQTLTPEQAGARAIDAWVKSRAKAGLPVDGLDVEDVHLRRESWQRLVQGLGLDPQWFAARPWGRSLGEGEQVVFTFRVRRRDPLMRLVRHAGEGPAQ